LIWRFFAQSGVVGGTEAKVVSQTIGVCVAVILITNVAAITTTTTTTTTWTIVELAIDYRGLLSDLERKPPHRDVVQILQGGNVTLSVRIGLEVSAQLPLQRSKPAENVPFRAFNESQSVRVAVTAIVKVAHSETVAAAPPQNRELFPAELREDLRKVRNDW
jgi:hypothetical protein